MATLLSVQAGSTLPTYEDYESVDTITIQIKIPVEEPIKKEDITHSRSVLCNCYAYVKQTFEELPWTGEIHRNLSDSGDVAVFYYPNSNLYHYAVVESESEETFTISETNFTTCMKTIRVISKSNIRLLGFYTV